MISLVFPPAASPTSVPLGVSFLKAHIDSTLGPDRLLVQDLNIRYWDYLTGQSEKLGDYKRFIRGETGMFSQEFYKPMISLQRVLKGDSERRMESVRRWLDTAILPDDLDQLFHFLAQTIPSGNGPVMFSCLFPDQFLFSLGFSRWLVREREDRIYLGGASVLLADPVDLLNAAPWLEGVFTGEGEAALEVFIREDGKSPVPGLYRRHDGKVVRELPVQVPSFEKLVPPDFSWADLSSYFNPEPVLPVQFSRGCKWRRCRFCAHNFSYGQYRCTEPAAAVDMLEYFGKTYGASHFYFTDQYLDASFLVPFAREVIARNLSIRYTFMGRPAEDMTNDVMTLLSQSGCRWISWGVESGSARLLDLANKGTNPGEVARVLRDSATAGIINQALMIFGLPGSDDNAAEETYSFLQDNRPWIHSHTASEFLLYKGTPFGNHPERYGLKVTGADVFCRIDGIALNSLKREYTNSATAAEPEILRGPLEARRWKRRKTWIYPDSFWDALPSEHFLILSGRGRDHGHLDDPVQGSRAG